MSFAPPGPDPTRTPLPYPAGIMRALYALPRLGYRAGFGDTLNALRIMILTTRGRKTGLPRPTPIEYRQHGSKTYAIAAWPDADWVKNLRADPICRVQQGRRHFTARATFLDDPGEMNRALTLFHRSASPATPLLDRVGADERGRMVIVRFDPSDETTSLPPLDPDLAWLLPALAFAAILALLLTLLSRRREP
ncbi:MAG: nitroreductase family deazaflavin-dependent oxidoreductase [Candidatus Flexifilum sp.]